MTHGYQNIFGTKVEIQIGDPEPNHLTTHKKQNALYDFAMNAAFEEMNKVHKLISFQDPQSEVSKINRLLIEGEGVSCVHPWTFEMLQISKQLYEHTKGLFDSGVAHYLLKWGVLPNHLNCRKNRRFTQSTLANVKLMNGNFISVNTPVCLDLGGVSKGYAVDRAIEVLRTLGIKNASVNAGGNSKVIGMHSQKQLIKGQESEQAYLSLKDFHQDSVSITAPHASVRSLNRKNMSNLVNPITGEAVLVSDIFAVAASSCAIAEGLSKALAIHKNLDAEYFNALQAKPVMIEVHRQ